MVGVLFHTGAMVFSSSAYHTNSSGTHPTIPELFSQRWSQLEHEFDHRHLMLRLQRFGVNKSLGI
jgi:hypothetical protein